MALVLLAVCATASATTVTSDLYVNTTTGADATLMSYSYVKEPHLVESGYTDGLKTGAFNYLVNGDFEFNDYYQYYDGLDDDVHTTYVDHNETVFHDLAVTFDGDKGISEFYGKGFFRNNRALSAWKKIRYDDFGDYVPGETYMASTFVVDGQVWMGPYDRAPATASARGDYDFWWDADVTEGVVEIWEATGWTNRTGAQRIDFEQTALIKGSVEIQNDLYTDNGLYIPAQGGADWLSCCIGDPVVIADGWPSDDTMKLLNCTCYPTETEAEF
jgi:hypothetical protein